MMPLFDMMMNAQNGDALKTMARQFGLSESQAEQAMEALMPAFSTGLKRNASTPQDLSSFLGALASGHHAKYFEDMTAAFSPQGMAEGNGILGHLFGSKDVSRAVAAQAAQATGIGQEILKQMLPVIASTVMGGLFKQSTGQMNAASQQGSNPLGDIIGQMMRQGMGGGTAAGGAGNNPLGQILEGMFGGGSASRPQATQDPFDNPLGQIFKDMMGGGMGGAQPRTAPAPELKSEPEPDRMPSGRERNPYDDLFGQMFDSGRKVQQDYQKGMESIFDQYLDGMKRQR